MEAKTEGSETLIAKLRKVQALAESGAAGERDAARAMLPRLLSKYGLTIDALRQHAVDRYWFRFSGRLERQLLFQCACLVLQANQAHYWKQRGVPNQIGFDLTELQYAALNDCWTHYRGTWRRLWTEQQQSFLHAFVNRNEIGGPANPDTRGESPLSGEQLVKLLWLMETIPPTPWRQTRRLPEVTR